MFNPANVSQKIKSEFIDYITTTFNFADEELQNQFREALHFSISKGPYVDIKDVFNPSVSINDLINRKILSPLFREIEQNKPTDRIHKRKLPLDRKLYSHQEKAIEKINAGKNVVITTGTGSGKTECFLIPIINELLREKEQGSLDDGVCAILIYPMNALANDQMKRLREILMYYPSITFGVYNGDTKETEKDAKAVYDDLHFNEDCEEIRSSLENERISREQMRERPPHILCTNYAMLEHMLLRPENDVIFSNSKFKFVVLDEAHIYSGATGMETALLLRRLKARIQNGKNKAQFILTSATLGEKGKSEGNIIKFAENLCGEDFDNSSIVFGERINEDFTGVKECSIDSAIFAELVNCCTAEEFRSVFTDFDVPYDLSLATEENLYNLCYSSPFYRRMRNSIHEPTNIKDFASMLNINIRDAVAFIFICTQAYKNNRALLDARYHFFMRALEGVYAPLYGVKEIYLERKISKTVGKTECKVFELALCKNCGEIAIVGTVKDGAIEQVGQYPKGDEKIRYFHICKEDDADFDEVEYDDLEEIDDEGENQYKLPKDSSIEKYYLCPICGKISMFDDGKPRCDCGVPYILLKEYKNNADNCVYCQNGKYNRFYLGNEAATAVIATSLFEELPSKTVFEREDDIEYEREGGKQFLAFSDSRSEAAFFASYMDKSYKEFLRRRGIIQLIEKNRTDMVDESWTAEHIVEVLSKLFYNKETFKEKLISNYSRAELKTQSNKNAWIAVLTELVNSRRPGSLTSLGFLQFKYAGNDKRTVDYFCRMYGIQPNICKSILDELAMTFAYFGAIGVDDSEIDQEDRKYIFYTYRQKAIYKIKATGASPEFSGWIARNREGKADAWYKNYRQQLLIERLGVDGKTANQILEEYFDNVIVNRRNEYHAKKGNGNFYYMPAKCFVVKVFGDESIKWYKCKSCGRITTINIADKCPILRCNGELEEVDIKNAYSNNHYIDLYKKTELTALCIREHTAQLSREEGLLYQEDFEKNRIHALSCSTTFEMGVDVGELETVFLRNVPPTSANYAQRAGRAGRSKNAAAYAVTYAKLSSHDFNYFKDPRRMISGSICPPLFKVDNEKVVLRHIFAVALSYCFKKNPDLFNKNSADKILNQGGYDEICNILRTKPADLGDLLKKSFPTLNNEFGISNYTWLDKFIGDEGIFNLLIKDYNNTVSEFEEIQATYVAHEDYAAAGRIKYRLGQFKDKRIIDFLARGNVLPKYGFPVDTVELDVNNDDNKKKELQLARDLKLAISEYAPGEKVVANNKMYTSRYLKQSIRNGKPDFYYSYVCECSKCHTWNYCDTEIDRNSRKTCVACNADLPYTNWDKAIEPRAGFISDGREDEVPMRKPDRIYKNDDSYIGNGKTINKHKYLVGDREIILRSTENDKIMVTSKTLFYVCPWCGFSYGILDKIRDENGKLDKEAMKGMQSGQLYITPKKKHKSAKGKVCGCNNLNKNVLNHLFSTDVVQMDFMNSHCDYNTMISVMYAVLNALSDEMDIERSDINGCLKYINADIDLNYSLILYDAVAGGAGHVRRLLDENGKNLQNVLHRAFRNMECSCDTSCYNCLRSYQNQKFHDILDHKIAHAFLADYQGAVQLIADITDETSENIGDQVAATVLHEVRIIDIGTSLRNHTIEEALNYVRDEIEESELPVLDKVIDKVRETDSCVSPDGFASQIRIDGERICQADLLWKRKKIILFFTDKNEEYQMLSASSEYRCFCLNSAMDVEEFVNTIKE
ncbi:MAG: DEAD/DEAH box helicase [Clostridia bacterium]|nr:DEAD/DEAH box helicase [Clostridia bacterium]